MMHDASQGNDARIVPSSCCGVGITVLMIMKSYLPPPFPFLLQPYLAAVLAAANIISMAMLVGGCQMGPDMVGDM